MFFENEDNRQKRVKAMLQYLILREACKFDNNFPIGGLGAEDGVGDGVEVQSNKDELKTASAKKILSEMESKFFDFFVININIAKFTKSYNSRK